MSTNEIRIKDTQVSKDIIPVGEFKADLAKYLNEIKSKGNSLSITQNGKPAGVLVSPTKFDELRGTKLFLESISWGILNSEKGEVISSAQLKGKLKKKREK